jgi:very-short-patch-repair endonuclease
MKQGVRITREQLEALKKKGHRVIGDTKPKNNGTMQTTQGRIVAKHYHVASPAKEYLGYNLLMWCNEHAVTLQEEYKFHPDRKFRFDWCIESLKLAIEYEGQLVGQGAHQHFNRFNSDIEKYNLAANLGWKVLRFSFQNYRTLVQCLDTHYKNFVNGKETPGAR